MIKAPDISSQLHPLCGVDEAGRGPLAGSVYAAAVILNPTNPIDGLADSKKLSEKKRDLLAPLIRHYALAWAVASASVEEIDSLNIHYASLLAMQRAIDQLVHIHGISPALVLVDGKYCPKINFPCEAIVQGDSKVAAISAASILAKTVRDQELYHLDEDYPQYGFANHKGYPTKQHLEALRLYGVSPVHRLSYAPVKALLQGR